MEDNTTHGYLPGIDGLRAIAVLAVVIYHTDLFSFFKGGFSGVDIFFVISGYVISRSLYNRPLLRFSRYLPEFYQRRIKRIIPALIFCLIVTIVASILFIPPSWLSDAINQSGLAAFWGYSNFSLVWHNDGYFSPSVEFNPFLHTWSLAVEEQFYLLFPLIFFGWMKFRKNSSAAGFIARALLAFLGMLSFGFSIFETTANHDQAFYLLASRFWELAAGALLFQLQVNHCFVIKSKNFSRGLMITGFLLIACGFVFAGQRAFPFPWAVVPVMGTLILINSITGTSDKSSFLQNILSSSVLTYIGKISYSLYLWHWPVLVFLRWTIGFETYWQMLIYLAASFSLAIISYHWIETKVRLNKFLLKQKNRRVIAGGIIILLIFFRIAQFVVKHKSTLSLSVTRDNYIWHSGWYRRDEPEQLIKADPHIAGRKIFAFGDSHTAAYRTMLHIVSGQLGIEVYEYEAGDCAIAGLLKPLSEVAGWRSFSDNSFQEIKALAKPGDLVFLASLRMPELSDRFEVLDIAAVIAEFTGDEAAKNRLIALEEASRIIEKFEELGLYVLIDAPKPVIKVPLFRCSDWFNRMNPIAAPGFAISRSFLLEIRQPVMDSLTILQKRHQDLYIWDPFYVLCSEEEFSAYDDNGLPLFYDGDHLSANGNRKLAPSFKEKILTIWEP